MANIRLKLGKWGEEATSRILSSFDYRILCRNYRKRFGEIDIVCLDQGELVFIEVKTRRISIYGTGEEAVTEQKERRLANAAQAYIHDYVYASQAFRIDLIILEECHPGVYRFRHLRGAIGDVCETALDAS